MALKVEEKMNRNARKRPVPKGEGTSVQRWRGRGGPIVEISGIHALIPC